MASWRLLLIVSVALGLVLGARVAAQPVEEDPLCPTSPELECTTAIVEENDTVISPPRVDAPYACGESVDVSGFVPGALLRVYVNAVEVATVASNVALLPERYPVDVASGLGRLLETGDQVTARQELSPAVSDLSEPAVVRHYTEDYPAGLPTPWLEPLPLYDCGIAVGATHLASGAFVEFFQTSGGVGGDLVAAAPTNTPSLAIWSGPTMLDEQVTAVHSLCGQTSPASAPEVVRPPPDDINAPVFAPDAIYDGQSYVALTRVFFGARVRVYVDATEVVSDWPATGTYDSRQLVYVPGGVSEGQTVGASQEFCAGGQPIAEAPVLGCDQLPAPQMQPPQIGDRSIELHTSVPGSRIQVYADGDKIGDGGGRRVALTRALEPGETVAVFQSIGSCRSEQAHVLPVRCRGVRRLRNQAGWGAFGVGAADYELPGVVDLGDVDSRVRATVRFPIDEHGEGNIPPWGRPFPLVLVMHGNAPNILRMGYTSSSECVPNATLPMEEAAGHMRIDDHHLGYVPLLEELARRGYIAVSIDAWDLNCNDLNTYLTEGANLYAAHLNWWKEVAAGTASYDPLGFAGRVDLERVGLVGHSRGAVRIPIFLAAWSDPDVDIRSVILLAPSELISASTGVPTLVIQGSRDLDLLPDFTSIVYYDQGDAPIRSQLYVYGATHFGFSSMHALYSEAYQAAGGPGRYMSPTTQSAHLSAYATRWFDWTARGIGVSDARSLFSGDGAVRGLLRSEWVYASFAQADDLHLDDHENDTDWEMNSAGGPVAATDFTSVEQGWGFEWPNEQFAHQTNLLSFAWPDPGAVLGQYVFPIDVSDRRYLSMRIAQDTTTGDDLAMRVTLTGANGTSSASIVVDDQVVEIPPQDNQVFTRTVMRTIRIPLACFLAENPDLGLEDLTSVELEMLSDNRAGVMDDLGFQY